MLRALEHLTYEERERELACSIRRRVAFGDDLQPALPYV